MKIIQICAAYKPAYVYGGPTMSVSKLSEELVKAGQDVTVLTTTANGKSELAVPTDEAQLVDGVKVHYFKRWTKDHTHFSPALFWFLHKTIRNAKRQTPNPKLIIHIHAWWNLVSIFSCLIAKLHGVKIILSPRGMLTSYSLNNRNSKFKDIIHSLLGKRLLKHCHIHATSKKELEDVAQTCEVNEITVIPNFIEFPKSIQDQTTQSEKYRLLFLSRIEQKKGLELLFEALAQTNINYQLSIAGTGEISYIENLKELTKKLHIHQYIKWIGHINGNDKFQLMTRNDLLVLPSYNENFANVVIEVLAVGTPILISDGVGLSDYVLENNLGWVSSNTPEQLAQTLHQSFLEKEKRESIRALATSIIKRDFDESILVKKYISLYRNLVFNFS